MFSERFPDDAACLEHLWRRRFSPDGRAARCPKCDAIRQFHRIASRPSYSCDVCGHHLHPTAGTIFHKSSTSLLLCFRAIFLLAGAGGDMPVKTLERELGVTYKTAWRMRRLIREQMTSVNGSVWRPGTISTFAGDGTSGYAGDGGPAAGAPINAPYGLAADGAGNLYIADAGNNVVRMATAGGIISTFAGTGAPGYSGDGGAATAAALSGPAGIAVDANGNVFVADTGNAVVRRVDSHGVITTVVGPEAELGSVYRVLPTPGGLLVAEAASHVVRRVDADGTLTTVAGNGESTTSGDGGPATVAGVPYPVGMAVDGDGNLYVAQSDYRPGNPRVRRIDASGTITTFAGTGRNGFDGDGGPATLAQFSDPTDLAVDAAGRLLVSDYFNDRVRMIDESGLVHTVAGTGRAGYDSNGGPAPAARLNRPLGLALGPSGDLFIADSENHRVRKVAAPFAPAPPARDGKVMDTGAAFEVLLAMLESESHRRGTAR